MKRVVVGAAALACAVGCSSFLHFSDPTAQSVTCGITSVVLGPLEQLAKLLGFPLPLVEDLYSEACNFAAAQGMNQHDAEQFGLKHATERAQAMHAMGLRVVEPTDGGTK